MSLSQFVPDRPHLPGTESRAGQVRLSEGGEVLAVLDVPALVLQPLGGDGREPEAQGGEEAPRPGFPRLHASNYQNVIFLIFTNKLCRTPFRIMGSFPVSSVTKLLINLSFHPELTRRSELILRY